MIGLFQSSLDGSFISVNPYNYSPDQWSMIQRCILSVALSYTHYSRHYEYREYCKSCEEDGKQTWIDVRQRECHVCGANVKRRNRINKYLRNEENQCLVVEKEWIVLSMLEYWHKTFNKTIKHKMEVEKKNRKHDK